MPHFAKASAGLAFVAALSMGATPVAAAELPINTSRSAIPVAIDHSSNAENAEHHRYRHRYRHRNRVDAGDVLAGVLIIGGIAAIASAASKNKRERDSRYRDDRYRDRDYDYRDRRGDSRYDDGSGIDTAVSMCVREIERDVRVGSVDGVDRTAEGWRVTGSLYDGEGFTCRIGSDGRIDTVDYAGGGTAYAAPGQDRQWDDDRYRAARADLDGAPRPAEPQPAYPGGPIDGDLSED